MRKQTLEARKAMSLLERNKRFETTPTKRHPTAEFISYYFTSKHFKLNIGDNVMIKALHLRRP